MKIERQFIRFVINKPEHEKGEKIKILNIISKTYEKNEITGEEYFLQVNPPYISAGKNQIEVDIEGTAYKKYRPLRHFRYDWDKKEIVRKSDVEIQELEAGRKEEKEKKLEGLKQKEKDINEAKLIMIDKNKPDKERLESAIKIINEKIK